MGRRETLCSEAVGETEVLVPEARCLVQVLPLVSGFSSSVQVVHVQKELTPYLL